MPESAEAPPTRPILARVRRALVALGLLATAFACFLSLVALALAKERPAWWRTVRRDDPATRAAADEVENGIVNLLFSREHSPEPGEASPPWRVALSAGDANAWLNAKMPLWIEAEFEHPVDWPEDLREVQVDFRGAVIRIGIRVAEKDQVFWAAIEPSIDDQGRLWLPARWAYLGRLPVPVPLVMDRVRRNPEAFVPDDFRDLPQTEALFRIFAGEVPAFDEPVVKLSDGRRVRLLGLTALDDGRLILTCRTERPSRASAGF